MAPTTRLEHRINLDGLGTLSLAQPPRSGTNSGTNSPIEVPAGSGPRHPLGNGAAAALFARAGAGSPSKEYGSRLFPKRAREIQKEEGLSPQIWGPPPSGSGHSTPLRETIPESPSSDSFPDFDSTPGTGASSAAISSTRRTRAGTVPSRFPSLGISSAPQTTPFSRSNRATPSPSPFGSNTPAEPATTSAAASNAALLSRLRAGSMPQRSAFAGGSSPFGSSVFASNWLAGRERSSTLQSVRSSDAPSSPRESPADNDVRTLDYLGLVDTPQSARTMDLLMAQARSNGPTIAELAAQNAYDNRNTASRFRSYSVNAKEKYADGEEDDADKAEQLQDLYAGQLTPSAESAAAQAALIHEAVRQHNLEVQAFANFATANRPRARTAGVLDSPSSRVLRSYLPTPSRLDNSISASDMQLVGDTPDFNGLTGAMQNLQMKQSVPAETATDAGMETPTKSLWLGHIPASSTVSSLTVIFSQFGPIENARVLTHKSCGFVNFENVASAIAAKAACNGKEIFPGCGPVRINYAKEQGTSSTTAANSAAYPTPSPDPFVSKARVSAGAQAQAQQTGSINANTAAAALVTPNLLEHRDEILQIVQQFGATSDDKTRIAAQLESAMGYAGYIAEMPAIPEPSHNRTFDAPRLRDLRKRIDNNSCTQMEIESIAMDMLPEIAELSSDYLGNTVVQKLFEHCSEDTKEAMLGEIAPHLAEIGVHKNGTWAAQKIIDVARTTKQMQMIVEALRPHTVNLFLDQYGNYVIQCCLRFQAPMNDFIFDTMLNKLWIVAQGRFGARAMRACLESHFATNDQKRLIAAAVALHSVQLATNSNGALLLTWFLDTCTFPQRRSVLAPRLIPHLVHLCTHKVAYLTVLKIVNQKNEPEARDSLLKALFFDEQTLTDIISDHACGATLIFKVLTTPFLGDTLRPECVEKVRETLVRLKAQPNQGYKRLMDEVGLSSRHGATPVGGTPSKQRQMADGQLNPGMDNAQQHQNGHANRAISAQQMLPDQSGLQRSVSMDSSGFIDPYNNIVANSPYPNSPASTTSGMNTLASQQLQYQQAMLAQAQSQMPRPPGFLPTPNGSLGYNRAVPNTVAGAQMMDPNIYRQNMSVGLQSFVSSPLGDAQNFMVPQQQQAFMPTGTAPLMGMNGMNGFAQYGVAPAQAGSFYVQPQQQQQQQQQQNQYQRQQSPQQHAGASNHGGRRGRQQQQR